MGWIGLGWRSLCWQTWYLRTPLFRTISDPHIRCSYPKYTIHQKGVYNIFHGYFHSVITALNVFESNGGTGDAIFASADTSDLNLGDSHLYTSHCTDFSCTEHSFDTTMNAHVNIAFIKYLHEHFHTSKHKAWFGSWTSQIRANIQAVGWHN